MGTKRNHEWPMASAFNGWFTQDQSGGVTEKVNPDLVKAYMESQGFVTKLKSEPSTEGDQTLTSNVLYVFGEVSSLNITLGTETTGVSNEYHFIFESGDTATTLTFTDTIIWADATPPEIAANTTYEISIVEGLGVWVGYSS